MPQADASVCPAPVFLQSEKHYTLLSVQTALLWYRSILSPEPLYGSKAPAPPVLLRFHIKFHSVLFLSASVFLLLQIIFLLQFRLLIQSCLLIEMLHKRRVGRIIKMGKSPPVVFFFPDTFPPSVSGRFLCHAVRSIFRTVKIMEFVSPDSLFFRHETALFLGKLHIAKTHQFSPVICICINYARHGILSAFHILQ